MENNSIPGVGLVIVAAIAILITAMVSCAKAQTLPQCQTTSPCKIIILSAEEEQALIGPNQILDTAFQGRPLDLAGKVNYFKDKIRNAPPGAPLEPPKQ